MDRYPATDVQANAARDGGMPQFAPAMSAEAGSLGNSQHHVSLLGFSVCNACKQEKLSGSDSKAAFGSGRVLLSSCHEAPQQLLTSAECTPPRSSARTLLMNTCHGPR